MANKSNKRFPSVIELANGRIELLEVIQKGQDAVCAIVLGAFLDHCLASYLQDVLCDEDVAVRMLQPGEPLGPFVARANLAYGLGLIPADLLAELKTIAKIRNLFAHRLFEGHFSDPDILTLVKSLKADELIEKADGKPPFNTRIKYVGSVALANQYILSKAKWAKRLPKNTESWRTHGASPPK